MIYSDLKTVLHKRNLTIRELSRITGVRYESLRKLYHDEVERFPRDVIASICNEINVDVSEIIRYKKIDRKAQ